jgi:5-formyltetrahydrofolate cyclo-ligase
MSDDIQYKKKQLRRYIQELKSELDANIALSSSNKIFSEIESLPEFKAAKTILVYWSLPDEVQTHSFIDKWYTSKKILLPLVVKNNLELRVFSGMDCLEARPPFGILEPVNGALASISEVEMVIVPGVAFDLNGNRMGRGKGFYDRLLKQKDIYKVGVCFTFQIVKEVPTNNDDITMNKIIYA